MNSVPEFLEFTDPIVEEMLHLFDVDTPPVPVELMLQRPREGTWQQIDLSEMSTTFLNLHDRYAPRMSVARLLARNIARGEWGKERQLGIILENAEWINLFARSLLVPKYLLERIDPSFYDVKAVSMKFEVPEADAEARLQELRLL